MGTEKGPEKSLRPFENLRAGSYRKQAHLCPKVSSQVAGMREVLCHFWKLCSKKGGDWR